MIDSHLHIGLNGWTEESLIRYLDEEGIEKAWLLTWDEENPIVPMYYESLDIEEVKKAFKNHPDRIVPFYAPDPGRTDWKERLSECLEMGFTGCGELKVPYEWDDPKVEDLLKYLNSQSIPLIFHMEQARQIFTPINDRGIEWFLKKIINERSNGKMAHYIEITTRSTGFLKKYFRKRMTFFPGYLGDFNKLEKQVSKYQRITFIAHGPDVWNHFSTIKNEYLLHQKGKFMGKGILWDLLEKYPNFYCDVSGFSGYNALSRNHGLSKEFLNKFSNKILFGTDNWKLGHMNLIKKLNLDKNIEEAIFSGNASRILQKND